MKSTPKCVSIVATALYLMWLSAPAQAHQQWLMPSFFSHDGEEVWVSFDHTFGDLRFQAGSAPGLYYQWWFVGPDQQVRSVPHLFAGKTKVVGEVELTETGTYQLQGVEPRMIWTKLRVDGTDLWQAGSRDRFEGQEIVESKLYFSKALAYVSLGPVPSAPPAASGDPIEIVFQQHPNRLEAGRGFEITLRSFGKRIADHPVQLFSDRSAGHDPLLTCTTDSRGACTIQADTHGRFLLRAQLQGPTPDDPSTDGFSYRLSVALEIRRQGATEEPSGD